MQRGRFARLGLTLVLKEIFEGAVWIGDNIHAHLYRISPWRHLIVLSLLLGRIRLFQIMDNSENLIFDRIS